MSVTICPGWSLSRFVAGEVCYGSSRSVKSAQNSSNQLKSAQISANQLRSAQISSDQLKSVQISSNQLKPAQITSDELKSARISPDQLKSAEKFSIHQRGVFPFPPMREEHNLWLHPSCPWEVVWVWIDILWHVWLFNWLVGHWFFLFVFSVQRLRITEHVHISIHRL